MAPFPPHCMRAPPGGASSKFTKEHLISHEQHLGKSQRFLGFLREIIHLGIFSFDILNTFFRNPNSRPILNSHDLILSILHENTFFASLIIWWGITGLLSASHGSDLPLASEMDNGTGFCPQRCATAEMRKFKPNMEHDIISACFVISYLWEGQLRSVTRRWEEEHGLTHKSAVLGTPVLKSAPRKPGRRLYPQQGLFTVRSCRPGKPRSRATTVSFLTAVGHRWFCSQFKGAHFSPDYEFKFICWKLDFWI